MRPTWLTIALLCMVVAAGAHAQESVLPPVIYTGMCDASGAVALDKDFLAVANDEDNFIRIYRRDRGGPPESFFDFSSFLNVTPKSPEADLEGAARIDDRIYWIGSHGRNKDAKVRLNRDQLFATDIVQTQGKPRLTPVGTPYRDLLLELAHDPRFADYHLERASQMAPKTKGALNIEGLCATAEKHLLIGFRNPVAEGRALVVPLLNPSEVVLGKTARLGDPILLDLGGLGIRDMAFADGRYLIIAGHYDGKGQSRLFTWSGHKSRPEKLPGINLRGLNAEAVVFYPDKGFRQFQLLSDDGTRRHGSKPCKELANPAEKRFRSVWIAP